MDLLPTKAAGGWKTPDVDEFNELATVVAYGDPVHWPGLTAPAVDALGAHLQEKPADDGESNIDKMFRAQIMTNALRDHENSLEQYERLAPVLQGLASLLHYLPSHKYKATARQMAELLRSAPTQALSGPLQPLVQAFRQRIRDGKISAEERRVLEQMIKDQVPDGPGEEALRLIADAL